MKDIRKLEEVIIMLFIYKLSSRTISQTLKHPQELQQKMLYHKKNAISAHVQYHSIVFLQNTTVVVLYS